MPIFFKMVLEKMGGGAIPVPFKSEGDTPRSPPVDAHVYDLTRRGLGLRRPPPYFGGKLHISGQNFKCNVRNVANSGLFYNMTHKEKHSNLVEVY